MPTRPFPAESGVLPWQGVLSGLKFTVWIGFSPRTLHHKLQTQIFAFQVSLQFTNASSGRCLLVGGAPCLAGWVSVHSSVVPGANLVSRLLGPGACQSDYEMRMVGPVTKQTARTARESEMKKRHHASVHRDARQVTHG